MSKQALQEKARVIETKRGELAKLFADHKNAAGEYTHDAQHIGEINTRSAELNTLQDSYTALKSMVDLEEKNGADLAAMRAPTTRVPVPGAREKGDGSHDLSDAYRDARSIADIGDIFVKSAAYKSIVGSRGTPTELPIDLKTVLNEVTGFAPQAIRTGQVILSPQQMPKIVDLIPSGTTDQIAVVFMQETLFTNAAAETAEGGLYPEAALAFTQVSSPVRKIPVFIPVTDEQLADVSGLRDLINNRLALMVKQRLDGQVWGGDGTGINLTGLSNTPGIQTQARGADPAPDAFFKGMTKIMTVGFADPDGVLMNPIDWQNVRLLRTADGLYIWGSPSDSAPARLWGLPVAVSTYVTLGKGMVADFGGYTQLCYKAGLEFEVSNSHADFFIRGQLAIRAQMRVAFVVYRPQALCLVSGL